MMMGIENIANIELSWLIIILFFLIAFLYASVGHGGASGYLSVMSILGIVPLVMKPSALILNIFVSGIAFIHFYKAGFFRLKLFLPFAITSVPAAFIGGFITIEPEIYRKTLGASLAIPAIRNFLTIKSEKDYNPAQDKLAYALFAGAGIGFLSGITGIGGGILLSPLILLFHWANMKETACVSALFIFVNSIAGLSGLTVAGFYPTSEIIPWIIAVLTGGLLGSYLGSYKLNAKALRIILSVVLLLASIKLIFF